MHAHPLGPGAAPAAVLRALARRAVAQHRPPPAALTGSWFGSTAVLVPGVDVRPGGTLPASPDLSGPPGFVGGGWVGYLSYPDGRGVLPGQAWGFTDDVLRLDADGCWWHESLSGADIPPDLPALVRTGAPARAWRAQWSEPNPAPHHAGVRACLAAITEGEVYQACICTRWHGQLDGSALELFADGVTAHDPARAALVQGAWGAVASFSPELFLARSGDDVRSSPIKGTLPITADPARLRASVKDVAENVMIVDLVRNDLGRVCVPGSISVPELLAVHPAPGVWHLVSTVTGRLRPDTDDGALLTATFPPASVTGTPKRAARGLLTGWEPEPRGVHCGAVGMRSPVAGLELNVAIRTVEVTPDGRAQLGVGGGITIDSDPVAEAQECQDKAAAITTLRSSVAAQPSRSRSTAS